MKAPVAPRRCPRCRAALTVPIVYGFPSPEMVTQEQRGDIIIGGCTIYPGMPTHGCARCQWPNDNDDDDDDDDDSDD